MTHIFRLLLLGLLLMPYTRLAAEWNNFIINYSKSQYGKGSQTWQIVSYDQNWVYFANKNGMLQYDGNIWKIFPMNNGSDVRSVFPSKNYKRIYAGGISEFGYYEPGPGGRLIYNCLSDSLSEPERSIGNVWGIHETDNILYLQGDSKVIKIINGKHTIIDSGGFKIDCSDMVNGILYVGTDDGVKVLVGNTFFPLNGDETLRNKRIRGVVPHQNGSIIATAYDGLYYYDGNSITPFITGVERFIEENEVFCIAANEQYIALGTVHKGIVLLDRKTFVAKYFNENNGLQNNTVLSVSFDPQGNLWAGLDSGIDYVCLNSYLTNLYTYPHSLGTGYDAVIADNYLYLATNRGLYYTEYPLLQNDEEPVFHQIPNSSGQVWSLKKNGNDLFCLHDRGVFLVQGTRMEKIGQINGAWTCQPLSGVPDKMYVGVYDGLYLIEKINGIWRVSHKIEGMTHSFRYFRQESNRVLWMSDMGRTLRVELDEELQKVTPLKIYGEDDGLPTGKGVYISKIRDKIYFSTISGIYTYDSLSDKMELSQEMNALLNGVAPYYYLTEYGNHLIGLNKREICISNLDNYKKGAGTMILPIDMSSIELVQGAETLIPVSDSLIIIPNDNGFALAKIPETKLRQDYSKVVHVRNVYISHPRDSLIYTDNFLGKKEVPIVSYAQNTIRIEYGISSFTHGEEVSYQYRLDKDEWSDFTKAQIKEYSNLSEGIHTFEVKAVFADAISATDSFSFRILPPWYRTNIAYVLYLLLVVFVLWLVYRWDDIRVKRKKQQVALVKDQEMRELEAEFERENARKQRQIMELEKEKLEHDLRYKSQEMANLMINFVRKNEILTEIKSDLFKVVSRLKGDGTKEFKQMLLVVNNKIDSNMRSDEVLKRIEEQFDLVHNNFMKRLQEKHPELSLNERMMCAYLIMNLSSKEIAPLLNISIRGVETIRYRIRKKFGLDREESLTEYLNTKL